MNLEITSLVLGTLFGSLFTVAIARPAAGRLLAMVAGVCLMGLGLAFAAWSTLLWVLGEPMRSPLGSNLITQRSESYAWGTGFLLSGALALFLPYRRRPVAAADGGDAAEPGAPADDE